MEEFSLFNLGAVLLRQRRTILFFLVVVPLVAVLITLFSDRRWTATASFMPQAATERARARLSNLAGQFGFDLGGSDAGQTPQFYADLVLSREILGKVVTDTFTVAHSPSAEEDATQAGTIPDLLQIEANSLRLRQTAGIRWLRDEAVSVGTDDQTGVVKLSVTTPWPELSSSVATRILEYLNEFNLTTRQTQAAAEREFIEARLEEARSELRDAEEALQAFFVRNRQFQNAPELVFEHDRLRRNVESEQQVYTALLQAYEQARIDEVRNTPVITIVEQPEEPVRPNPRRRVFKVFLGLVLGGILGVMVAMGREYFEWRKREAPEEYRALEEVWADSKADLRSLLVRVTRK